MAATGNASTSKARTTRSSASRSTTQSKTTQRRRARTGAVNYVRLTGERAVDVPVGAVLTARDRINGAVEPWTSTQSRRRELDGLRRQVETELGKFERRGSRARRQATERVRKTGNRVTARVRGVESTVKERRTAVESGLRKAQSTVQERVSALA